MGLVRTALRLTNPVVPSLAAIECQALADTGALHLCIPEHIAIQLQLSEREKREVTLADGSKRLISYVGPVAVHFGNRQCFVGAMVIGDEVLLGAIPLEDLDLIVRPVTQDVVVNPRARASPRPWRRWSTRQPGDAPTPSARSHAARLPNFVRFSRCFSFRGGSLKSLAALPPRMLCLPFSLRNGRS